MSDIDEEEILEYLAQNKKFLEGVMITGGEPTILFEAQGAIVTEREDKIAHPLKQGEGGPPNDLLNFIYEIIKNLI